MNSPTNEMQGGHPPVQLITPINSECIHRFTARRPKPAMKTEPGRSDHVPRDVLCVVLCVVLIIELLPSQSVLSVISTDTRTAIVVRR